MERERGRKKGRKYVYIKMCIYGNNPCFKVYLSNIIFPHFFLLHDIYFLSISLSVTLSLKDISVIANSWVMQFYPV